MFARAHDNIRNELARPRRRRVPLRGHRARRDILDSLTSLAVGVLAAAATTRVRSVSCLSRPVVWWYTRSVCRSNSPATHVHRASAHFPPGNHTPSNSKFLPDSVFFIFIFKYLSKINFFRFPFSLPFSRQRPRLTSSLIKSGGGGGGGGEFYRVRTP